MSTRSRKRSAAQITTSASSTSSPSTAPVEIQTSRSHPATPAAAAAAAGPSTKRQRTDHDRPPRSGNSARAATALPTEASIEEINLIDDEDPLSISLQKQREQQVKDQARPSGAQAGDEEKESKLNSLTCAICLEQPTDLTATSCGHLFCNECLISSLVAGETSTNGEARKSSCPICRKTIGRKRTGTDVIPLAIMTRGVARKGKGPLPATVRSDASVA